MESQTHGPVSRTKVKHQIARKLKDAHLARRRPSRTHAAHKLREYVSKDAFAKSSALLQESQAKEGPARIKLRTVVGDARSACRQHTIRVSI